MSKPVTVFETNLNLHTTSYPSVLGMDSDRLQQLEKVIDNCLDRGVAFDDFFTDYIQMEGKCVFWNPFWRHGKAYSPAELYMQLRQNGYGKVPEAAVNVFWQLREIARSIN